MTNTGQSIVRVQDVERLDEVVSAVESAGFRVLDKSDGMAIFLVDAEVDVLVRELMKRKVPGIRSIHPNKKLELPSTWISRPPEQG